MSEILYQTTVQALSNALHNATAAQQQSYVIGQASTTQGVISILSVDETSAPTDPVKPLHRSTAEVQAAAAPAELAASPDVQRLLDELSHETADVAYHVRSLVGAFAASLDALSIAVARQQLRILQNAAIAACMHAMIEQPDKARELEQTLEIIKRVV